MKAVSERFNDRPMSPQESIVYWTEYVIKHNGAFHLRTAGADMTLYQYLLLDVAAVSAVVFGVIFYSLFMSFRVICGLCCNRVKKFTATEIHKKRL